MNRFSYFRSALAFTAFFLAVMPLATAHAATEQITSFSVALTLDRDAHLFVQEGIDYNFGDAERHGIYRTIPTTYQSSWATLYGLRTSVNDVEADGAAATYTKSSTGNNVMVKIGNPAITISGAHTYNLTYEVERAILTDSTEKELYWNAIGTDWTVPITSSTITLTLPSNIAQNAKLRCFIGLSGSTTPCDTVNQNGSTFTLRPGRTLLPGEALTIDLRVPADALGEPSQARQLLWFLEDNFLLFSPLLIGLICFLVWLRWGKDPHGRGTIIAEYEPPKELSALEIGTMIDQRVDQCDIASIFITWATRGYIVIREIPGKKLAFEFEKKHDGTDFSTPQEQALFSLMFAKGPVYKPSPDSAMFAALNAVKNATYQKLVNKGLFVIHPSLMRTAFFVAGLTIGFGGGIFFASAIYPDSSFSIVAFLLMALNGGIIAFTGRYMPRVTPSGAIVVEQIKGFKLFLSVTEAARLKFFNAPEKKPEHFEKFLACALALGVEKEWASQFSAMHVAPPSWYQGSSNSIFTPLLFAQNLSGFTTNVHSSMASLPNSKGGGGFSGGSSGGGFGGGGGGSW